MMNMKLLAVVTPPSIYQMTFKDLNKDISWFPEDRVEHKQETRNKKQEKPEPEQKIIALHA